jgi:zinc-ribbon domain
MSQTSTTPCSRCGTAIPANMRFCPNCGTPLNAPAPGVGDGAFDRTQRSSTPPPPPLQAYPQQVPQQAPQGQQGYQQSFQAAPPAPAFAKPQKDSSKGVLGQIGCGVGIVILLIVLVIGTAGFFGYRWLTSKISSASSTLTSGTGSNTTNGNSTTPSVPLTTTQINSKVTYASVDITILNVQEASSFTDDPNPNSPVSLRVNLKEHNTTAGTVGLFYSDTARLILPDGTSVSPGGQQQSGAIDQAVDRNNWLDFPLSSKVDISKLTLRLGAATETQMDIPLTGQADLSKYQPKTISPNTPFKYAGLNWTITTVTSSLSAAGKQADKGMRFIVVGLKVDNPTQDIYYLFPNDYVRLQTGTTTTPPTGTTFDSSFAAGTTGTTGTITFLMTQSSSPFTLNMLARTDITPAASQVTTGFQI